MTKRCSILTILLGSLLALLLLLAAAGLWLPRRSFPKVKGKIQATGLQAEVNIYRDNQGVPHIYAANSHDLFFAQGYVHAQDRFWQMDFWRHIGSARLAEMFGENQIDKDLFLRTLGFTRTARLEWEAMDPANQAVLQAYADGVNAYLKEHKGSQLSLEYAVLGLLNPKYEVEPWEPIHTLTWAKMMAWDLGSNMDLEIQRAILMQSLSPQQIAELFPPYPPDRPTVVPGFRIAMGAAPQPASLPTNSYARLAPLFEDLAASLKSIHPDDAGELGLGSNNWVIAGSRTASGKPLLADDMHLSEQIPAIWYQVDLQCAPVGVECPFKVTGFSFAGVPGVVVGHNDRISWGFTNVGPDVQDLYIEKINPQNPDQYEYKGEWVDMQTYEEIIQVPGKEPVLLKVRKTNHGPIISEVYGPLEEFNSKAGLELPPAYAVSLRWTALEPTRMVNAILQINLAQDWTQFRQAAQDFAVPSQNMVFADVDGNIAYQTPGWLPIRASGHDGTLPVPGWSGEYEWQGYIPFEELPNTFNPERGYIVSANNAIVRTDYPYLITTTWSYGQRAARIIELIENAPGPIDAAYLQTIHGDNKDLNAEVLVPVLQQTLTDIQYGTPAQAQGADLLATWDFQSGMDSAPAALFNVFWKQLLVLTFNDELPEDYQPTGGGRWFEVMRSLVKQPDSPWWDIKDTPQVEKRDEIFRMAYNLAVAELVDGQGENPSKWSWGELHTIMFHHQSLGLSGVKPVEALFNRGPYPASGGSDIVNATGWSAAKDSYQVMSVPSERLIVDLGNFDLTQSVITTGQSGHAYHPQYTDLIDPWRLIQYHPLLWSAQAVQAQSRAHLVLTP